jgi:hypothetical protein
MYQSTQATIECELEYKDQDHMKRKKNGLTSREAWMSRREIKKYKERDDSMHLERRQERS